MTENTQNLNFLFWKITRGNKRIFLGLKFLKIWILSFWKKQYSWLIKHIKKKERNKNYGKSGFGKSN
jgi:hypothetical protein